MFSGGVPGMSLPRALPRRLRRPATTAQLLDQTDLYCPVVRGETRRLAIRMAEGRDLPKLDSACTTIVMARA